MTKGVSLSRAYLYLGAPSQSSLQHTACGPVVLRPEDDDWVGCSKHSVNAELTAVTRVLLHILTELNSGRLSSESKVVVLTDIKLIVDCVSMHAIMEANLQIGWFLLYLWDVLASRLNSLIKHVRGHRSILGAQIAPSQAP